MVDIGCEIGNHSWDHPSQTLLNMSMDDVLAEFQKTDDALKEACGQISTVAGHHMEPQTRIFLMRYRSHSLCGHWIQRTGN